MKIKLRHQNLVLIFMILTKTIMLDLNLIGEITSDILYNLLKDLIIEINIRVEVNYVLTAELVLISFVYRK